MSDITVEWYACINKHIFYKLINHGKMTEAALHGRILMGIC